MTAADWVAIYLAVVLTIGLIVILYGMWVGSKSFLRFVDTIKQVEVDKDNN